MELLSVALLEAERPTVERFRKLAAGLRIGLGWHYVLDLAWITRTLGPAKGLTILDAGAGTGVLQWYLAREGGCVISVDRGSRRDLPSRFRDFVPVRGLRPGDLAPDSPAGRVRERARGRLGAIRRSPDLAAALLRGYRPSFRRPVRLAADAPRHDVGQVVIYNEDLASMRDLPDESVDAVVSLSSLEHNSPDQLDAATAELFRVLRPGGRLIATTSASPDGDWFHEPAQGWCYSEATVRRVFRLPASVESNYGDYDEIFEGIRSSSELRTHLDLLYFRSGENGMPWGRWNPTYLPVGVCAIKEGS